MSEEKIKGAASLQDLFHTIRAGADLPWPVFVLMLGTPQPSPQGAGPQGGTLTADPWLSMPTRMDRVTREYVLQHAESRFFLVRPNTADTDNSQSPITVGRSQRCDICIEHDSVSKLQATIFFDRATQKYHLIDEYARNGTKVNHVVLRPGAPMRLNSLDLVSFGEVGCLFLEARLLLELARDSTL